MKIHRSSVKSTVIRVWNGGGLTPALRMAADLIDNNTTSDHIIDHIYTEYSNEGWRVNIVVGRLLPSMQDSFNPTPPENRGTVGRPAGEENSDD